jgi:hypothetical protein
MGYRDHPQDHPQGGERCVRPTGRVQIVTQGEHIRAIGTAAATHRSRIVRIPAETVPTRGTRPAGSGGDER